MFMLFVQPAVRLAALHVAGAAFGWALDRAGLPLAFLIGPMLLTVAAGMVFAMPDQPVALRQGGQWIVGTAIGLYMTPAAWAHVLGHGWLILGGSVLVIAIALGIATVLWRVLGVPAIDAFAGTVPGGPVEMATLAEGFGGRPAEAAVTQTIRIVSIVLIVPALLAQGGVARMFMTGTVTPALVVLLAATLATGEVMRRLKIINPFFMGPMLFVSGLSATSLALPAVPGAIQIAALVCLGVALGSMFRQGLRGMGLRFLVTALGSTAMFIGLCLGAGYGLAGLAGVGVSSMLLATAPGSITEMALTAKVLGLDVSLITAFHITRIVMIMALITAAAAVIARWR